MSKLSALDILVNLAINQYNEQYGYNFTADEMDIVNITNNKYSTSAYELSSKRTDDAFFIRLYCVVGEATNVGVYSLLERGVSGVVNSDSVFVAGAIIGRDLLEYDGSYIRGELNTSSLPSTLFTYLGTEDNSIISTEDGNLLTL